MAFSHLWFWVLAASLHGGACASDKYTKEWVQKYPSSAGTYPLNGILFANDQFLAYGRTKVLSTDGVTWTRIGSTTDQKLRGVTYAGNGKYVALGDRQLDYSEDGGQTWGVLGLLNMPWEAYTVASGAGKYITGGNSESRAVSIASDPKLGSAWHLVTGPPDSDPWKIYDIIYTDVFVGCGDGILTSDGISWSRRHTSTTALHAIAFGNGIYVAVGDQGTIVTSTDSNTWTEQTSTGVATSVNLWGVAYGLEKFVAVDAAGNIYASKDGITWTAQSNKPANIALGNPAFSNHLAFGKGQFVVVGSNDAIYVALDNCTCDACSECSTEPDCTGISCLWDGTSSCFEPCSSGECSSCPSEYSCTDKGDPCTWSTDTGCTAPSESDGDGGGSVVFRSHWAWCLMICLSIILLH